MDRPLKIVVGVALLVAFVMIVAGGYLVARRKARDVRPGSPDRVTSDVVSGLMTELRKAQAEASHWKAAAERLQRELDGRP
ncbi:MAG TPA: hypothetical protein VG899_10000 [Mycobacteriales bacterium]|nr:hypothetical protein [Mycobacteriales bacterium]HWA66685.1 hypothetical protein [Mycobacteriales bacterium]